jgi:signal transduction histidine kinase
MPVHALHELTQDERLLAIASRLARMERGVILTTGQARSGKVTTLMSLARLIGGPGSRVAVLTDRPESLVDLHPLPDGWREMHVEASAKAWAAALQSPAVTEASLVLIASLDRENAQSAWAFARQRRVLAAADTALIGLDAAHALYEMGIDDEAFAGHISGIWSQFLVESLCTECAMPARLLPGEMDYLFPGEALLAGARREVGCPACEGRGTRGREAVCEVLRVDDAVRPAVTAALLEGSALRLAPEWHLTAQDHGRSLVAGGAVGVGTYGRAIRRNPLLRSQSLLEREQTRSSRLDAASRHKSEFLANMSHELRTPLNAIIGFSEVLMGGMAGPIAEKQKEFVGDIHESGKHLLSLINDILDLSKIEAGKMELEVAPFDLPGAIGNAITLVRGRADRHGVRLEASVAAEVAAYEGDERKVKQILLNLLTNAVKFTPEGGSVTLSAERRDGAYEIAVKDTGIGIAEEDLGKLFEEFRQVGTDAARKAEGTGLGLALTRRLVELHGGTIRVASAVGRGSTFTFSLPIVLERAPA